MSWLSGAKWLGTVAGVGGAILIALNLGMATYGFWLYLISSVLWLGAARIEPFRSAGRLHRH